MAGPRPEKVAVVEDVREHLNSSSAAILTEYRGLKVGDLATLRRQLRTRVRTTRSSRTPWYAARPRRATGQRSTHS